MRRGGTITVGDARRQGLNFWLGCGPCKVGRYVEPSEICHAFDSWTVEELHRAGHFLCSGCDEPPVLFVYRCGFDRFHDELEKWPAIRLRAKVLAA